MTVQAQASGPAARPWRQSARRGRLLRRLPLLVHITGFALLIFLPALLFSVYLVVQFSRQQEQLAAGQVADTAVIVSSAIDREIYGMLTAANVLASSPFIDEDDLSRFHERTGQALHGANAVLVDQSMDVVLNTRLPFPMEPRPTVAPDVVEKVFKTRTPQVSDVYFGPNAEDFLFHVAVPVIRNNKVVYVLVVNRPAESLGALITSRTLPEAWATVVKDGKGHRVFAALSSGSGVGLRPVAQENPSIAETLGDGDPAGMIEASQSSFLTGWTTTVAVPRSVIDRTVLQSWKMLAAAGIVLLMFCVMLAFLFGRWIAAPIQRLSDQAEAIGKGQPAVPIRTNIEEIGEVSKVLALASRERREAEEQNRLLMREMTHRAKNQYALIAAIARRAAKESSDTSQFLATLSDALNSLARSADLLAGKGWDSAPLRSLVASQLQAFGASEEGGEQFTIRGPMVQLNPSAAQTIGLALHELATNAAKYGALSVDEGAVEIEWNLDTDFVMTWRELGGPAVSPPRHQGFGSLVVKKMTARGLGGDVDMEFAPTGVVWRLVAPADSITVS
ncbi:sensor histidine kinase [Consotaella aegiceratis]|uniref:sensor histidine kinase n=1 Tax=Consotaella aegiceratis TaxID=3097961 RepID=UPI002F3E57E0